MIACAPFSFSFCEFEFRYRHFGCINIDCNQPERVPQLIVPLSTPLCAETPSCHTFIFRISHTRRMLLRTSFLNVNIFTELAPHIFDGNHLYSHRSGASCFRAPFSCFRISSLYWPARRLPAGSGFYYYLILVIDKSDNKSSSDSKSSSSSSSSSDSNKRSGGGAGVREPRYDDRDRGRDSGRDRAAGGDRCFNCGKPGHFARDCKDGDWSYVFVSLFLSLSLRSILWRLLLWM